MKISNNALNFLLAQYRAIFKRAYVKGIASAVLLTAGLAAGSAQADDIASGAASWDAVTSVNNVLINDGQTYTFSGGKPNNNYNDITIQSGGLTVKNDSGGTELYLKGTLRVDKNGTLTVGGAAQQALITGYGGFDNGEITTDITGRFENYGTTKIGGENNKNSNLNSIQVDDVLLAKGSTTTLASSGGTTGNWDQGVSLGAIASHEGTGFTIQSDATVVMGNQTQLYVGAGGNRYDSQMQIAGGIVKMQSTESSGAAYIRAIDNYYGGEWHEGEGSASIAISDKAQVVVSGHGAILSPNTTINNATIDVQSGALTLDGDFASGATGDTISAKKEAGNFVMSAGLIKVAKDATLTIGAGTTAKDNPEDDTIKAGNLTTLDIQGGELAGQGAVQVEGKFAATTKTIETFLSGKDSEGTQNNGRFVFSGGNTVFEFKDQADLADYTWSGTGTAEDFIVTEAGTVQGENLAISSNLQNASNAAAGVDDKLSVKATNLTLGGGEGFTSASSALGVKDMTAQNVAFLTDSGSNDTFTLKDKLTLIATQEITNPYDSTQAPLTYAATGTIDGDVVITNGDKKGIVIQAGHYTTNDDITISGSGSRLMVYNTNNTTGVDASLTLDSSSTLSLIDGAKFTVNGDSSKTINFGDHVRSAEVYADISAAELVLSGDGSNINRFDANNGTLIMDEDQLAKIVNSNNTSVVLQNYGTAIVQGDIAGENNSGLDVSKFAKTVKAGSVVFANNNGGILEATGQIWLKADNSTNKLDISDKGTLQAETFRLDNVQDIPSTDTTTVRQFVVADGTLIAGSTVTTSRTDHNSTLTLGDGTSGSTLQLGYIENNVDEWGIEDHTYTTSSDTGTVSQNLTLSGSGSVLDVEYGSWSAQDIAVTGTSGAIFVGSTDSYYDADGNEVVFNAALSADELTLSGTNGTVDVNDNGTLSVNGLTMSNGTVTVHGQMTVAGVEPASDDTDPDYGVNITGGSFTVEGRNAQLTFGEQAVKNITVSGDAVTAENFTNNITVEDYATLRLEFADGVSFTEEALSDLRQSLLANATDGLALDDGYIHLGSGSIAGLNVSGGTIDWDVLEKFKDIKDIRTTGMDSATLTNVDEQDIITANVGNIQANGNTQNVQLSDSVLSSAKDLGNGTSAFITNANGEVIGATVKEGAVVGFNGGGAVRDLVINSSDTVDGNATVVNIAATGEAVTSFESIRGGSRTELNVDGVTTVAKNMSVGTLNLNQSLTVAGDTTIEDGLYSDPESTIPAVLNTTRLTVKGDTEFGGNINATGKAVFDSTDGNDQDTYLAGNNSFAVGVDFIEGNVELAHGTTDTTELTLNNVEYLLLSENAQLTADKISVTGNEANKTIISVGEVAGQDGSDTWGDSTGYLTAGNIYLNGATLIVDPAYGSAASIAVTDTLGNITAQQNHDQYAGGVLDGNFVAARNGIIAVGVADTQDATAIEQVQDAFATLMDNNGSLKADDVGAIVWVGKNIQVQDGNKIVVDSTKNRDEYLQAIGGTSAYAQNVRGNDVYIAKNSALAVDKAALSQVYNGTTQAAIHFNKAEASLYNEAGGKVILTGDDFRTGDTITLFTDNGAAGHEGIWIRGNDLEVSTLNGLLHFVLTKDTETTGQTLGLNRAQVEYVFNDSSAPVKHSLISYAAKNNNWAGTAAEADPLVGAQVGSVTTTDGVNYTYVADGTPVSDASNLMSLQGEDGTYTVYEKPYNYFLDEVVKGYSGAAAEAAARLGVYGGAPQAAIKAGQSSTDAIAARFGIGSALSNLTVAGNSQGAALWLAPVYKTSDSDGFDAQGVDYGVNVDLYGVALGADYTLANGISFGAMFNVGSGEVDGEGAASPVTNDFDYYGFGAYAGYTMGQFSVVADNEIEANTAVDRVGATMDSTNLSLGVTGKYELSFNGVNVTPHVGLRYSNIDLDDYTIDGEEVVASADSDKLNLFSIPVGVTIAKEFKGESWTVAPSFDLTLTGQFGDDELDGSVSWAGVSNLTTDTTTEVFDNFTYGATLGVEAQSVGGVALGINVGYTGSSNVDEFGVNANARFVF